LLQRLNETIENLADNPYMGRKRNDLMPNLRSFVQGKYVIFYFPISNGIDIIRILHGARDIQSIFEDENDSEQ
jgi:toxin ParE1/3/4